MLTWTKHTKPKENTLSVYAFRLLTIKSHSITARSEIPTLSDAGTPDNQHACAQVQALQNKVQALEKQIAQQHKAHRSEVQLLKNDKLVVEALLEEARGSA